MKNLFVPTQSSKAYKHPSPSMDKEQVKSISRTNTMKQQSNNSPSMSEETASRMIDNLLLKVEAGLSNYLSHATMEKAIKLIETLQNLREREVRYRRVKGCMDKSE